MNEQNIWKIYDNKLVLHKEKKFNITDKKLVDNNAGQYQSFFGYLWLKEIMCFIFKISINLYMIFYLTLVSAPPCISH